MAGTKDTGFDLRTVIRFSPQIFFDYDKGNCLYLFLGGKAFAAKVALTAPADRIAILRRTGINDSGVFFSAKRTFHW